MLILGTEGLNLLAQSSLWNWYWTALLDSVATDDGRAVSYIYQFLLSGLIWGAKNACPAFWVYLKVVQSHSSSHFLLLFAMLHVLSVASINHFSALWKCIPPTLTGTDPPGRMPAVKCHRYYLDHHRHISIYVGVCICSTLHIKNFDI